MFTVEASVFDVLETDNTQRRVAARRALALAHVRVESSVGKFLRGATSEEEFEARLGLVQDDFEAQVYSAAREVGHDHPEHIATALTDHYRFARGVQFEETPSETGKEKCPTCGGTGRDKEHDDYCQTCGGTGYMEKSAALRKEAPGNQHMPGVSPKRNRQYEHIKEQCLSDGGSEEHCKEMAARTVNKERSEHGETKKGTWEVTAIQMGQGGGGMQPLTPEEIAAQYGGGLGASPNLATPGGIGGAGAEAGAEAAGGLGGMGVMDAGPQGGGLGQVPQLPAAGGAAAGPAAQGAEMGGMGLAQPLPSTPQQAQQALQGANPQQSPMNSPQQQQQLEQQVRQQDPNLMQFASVEGEQSVPLAKTAEDGNTGLGGPEPKMDKRNWDTLGPPEVPGKVEQKDIMVPIGPPKNRTEHPLKEIGDIETMDMPAAQGGDAFADGGVTKAPGTKTFPKGNSASPVTQQALSHAYEIANAYEVAMHKEAMGMSAQDFRMLADAIRTAPEGADKSALAGHVAQYLQHTNPLFDADRFMAAAIGEHSTGRDVYHGEGAPAVESYPETFPGGHPVDQPFGAETAPVNRVGSWPSQAAVKQAFEGKQSPPLAE